MSKVHFVTFGCDNVFKLSRQRLANEAKESGWFDNIFVYGPENLTSYNRGFETRGAGYWWWKATVQSLALSQIDDGDLLLYLDAGFYLNKYAKNVFDQYVDIVKNNAGFLALGTPSIEKLWTKRDLFKLLDCDRYEYTDSNQVASGLVIYKKNDASIKFLQEYQTVSLINHAMDDHPSYNQNYEGFIEHRHDQSVFGLLVKKLYKDHNIAVIDYDSLYGDEVELVKKWMMDKTITGIEDLKHPFLATRINDMKFQWT